MAATMSRRGRIHTVVALTAVMAGVSLTMAPAGNADQATPQHDARAVASTPPMGWNTWNTFGCDVNEDLIRQMADSLVDSGMTSAGYRYVVIDDCWFDPERDAQGNLRAAPDRFPHGIKALADYVHAKGLRLGIYQVPTEKTCAQRGGAYPGETGSRGHEVQDARTFASWGIDYLKYDWCSPEGSLEDQKAAFTTMRDALEATGRPIVYSINPNSYHDDKNGASYDWGHIADMWRTTEDIKPVWNTGHHNAYPMGVVNIVDINRHLADQAGPGHWNDPDMLEVGVYDVEGFKGLTDTEARAHFSLWAMMAAPLIAGNDVRAMPEKIRAILTNREVIAIDQDPLGIQGKPVRSKGGREVWVKPLSNGDRAVLLFNRTKSPKTISASLREAGMDDGTYRARNLWTREETSVSSTISADVPAHGVALFRVGPTE
ncbi:glycoside hydrolase family 27 protein [Streptomyces luteolus]|uniref:Alpha-galactosidase n=1 Tax=Streptomyces luteolus TaxID=3043615 RepID=A0ABT6SQB8_9ACTN|nr:glycoside hydrolase family 27 protein [Streptomyces sp. B-S-A12]MDI3417586.1 glycoside hydrolase family 27 protein [Streptomyces sp. B-S-A12]